MRSGRSLWIVLAIYTCLAGTSAGAVLWKEIPTNLRLASKPIPTPPEQAATWKAPETKLSKDFVSATATLFRQGLADPRGCEYRAIEVGVGNFGGLGWQGGIVKTHGWIIPDSGKQRQRFAVCWNGLVYPLASIGKPADVRADALAAAKAEPEHFQQAGTWWHGVPPNFEDMCLCDPSEARSVSYESPLPIKACLLLRLGEAELAEKLWSHWTSRLRSFSKRPPYLLSVEKSVGANKSILKDPYLALANCWIMALSDRAVGSHMRGDDHLAMVSRGNAG